MSLDARDQQVDIGKLTTIRGMNTTTVESQEKRRLLSVASENEVGLALQFLWALEDEDYRACNLIKQEFEYRIRTDRINHQMMQCFRQFDVQTGQHVGPARISLWNGLFDDYFRQQGVEVE